MRNSSRIILTVASVAMCLVGCMASGIELTKSRAAFDFNCPEEKIEVKMLSGISERGTGAVFGAQGCGKRATYIRQEQAGMTLNSEVTEDTKQVAEFFAADRAT